MLKKLKPFLGCMLLAWWFSNTWPGSGTPTLIGPFRSLSQSVPFRQAQTKLKAKVGPTFQDSEPLREAWHTIINGISEFGGLSLVAGPFSSQAECETFRSSVVGEDVTSACWPGK